MMVGNRPRCPFDSLFFLPMHQRLPLRSSQLPVPVYRFKHFPAIRSHLQADAFLPLAVLGASQAPLQAKLPLSVAVSPEIPRLLTIPHSFLKKGFQRAVCYRASPLQIRRTPYEAYRNQSAVRSFRFSRRMIGLAGRAPIGMAVLFRYDKRFRRSVYLLRYCRRFFTLLQRPAAFRTGIQGYFNACIVLLP